MIDDEPAGRLIKIDRCSRKSDPDHLAKFFPFYFPALKTEIRFPCQKSLRLHGQKNPHSQRRSQSQAESFHMQDLHKEEVQKDINPNINKAGDNISSCLVLYGKECRERIAQHERNHSDCLAQQILVKNRSDDGVTCQNKGKIQKAHQQISHNKH